MKELRKILKKAGPLGLVVLAALVIFLLMRLQPKVTGGRALPMPAVSQQQHSPALDLLQMRATAFLQLLQRLQIKNASAFTFNATDTSGRTLTIITNDEAMRNNIFFDDRGISAAQQSFFKSNGIVLNASSIQLPLKKEDGVLMVTMPTVMAYSMAK